MPGGSNAKVNAGDGGGDRDAAAAATASTSVVESPTLVQKICQSYSDAGQRLSPTQQMGSAAWQVVDARMLCEGIVTHKGRNLTMSIDFARKLKTAPVSARMKFVDMAYAVIEHNSDKKVQDVEYLDRVDGRDMVPMAASPRRTPERFVIPDLELKVAWVFGDDGSPVRPVLYSVFPGTNFEVDLPEALTLPGHVTLGLFKSRCRLHAADTDDRLYSMAEEKLKLPWRWYRENAEVAVSFAYTTACAEEEGVPIMHYGAACLVVDGRYRYFLHVRSANRCVADAVERFACSPALAQITRGAPYSLEVDEQLLLFNLLLDLDGVTVGVSRYLAYIRERRGNSGYVGSKGKGEDKGMEGHGRA